MAVTCSALAYGVQDYGLSGKMTSGWIPFSAPVGSTMDTCLRQFTEVFFAFFGSDCRKLWSLRSCSPSWSSTSSSWYTGRSPWSLRSRKFPSCTWTRWSIPLLQVVHFFPVVMQRLVPMVQTVCRTVEILPLLHTVFNAPVVQGVLVVDIPVVQSPIPMVLPVRKTI